MTQENKQLLLKVLCAMLPYHIIVNYRGANIDLTQYARSVRLENCKPYLRPLSSMTEEETEELRERFCYEWEESVVELMYYSIEIGDADYLIDWFLEHHFDYRGLIEKGLAIVAPEDMYK